MHIAKRSTFWRRFYNMLLANDNKNSVWATHAPSDMHVLLASEKRWESRGSSLNTSIPPTTHKKNPEGSKALSPSKQPETFNPQIQKPNTLDASLQGSVRLLPALLPPFQEPVQPSAALPDLQCCPEGGLGLTGPVSQTSSVER